MKLTKLTPTLIALLFIQTPLIQAALISIDITAEIDHLWIDDQFDDPFNGNITIGNTIQGRYTYDSSILDSDSSPSLGQYWQDNPLCGFVLNTNGFQFQTDPDNVSFNIEIGNDHPWDNPEVNYDHYYAGSHNNLPLPNGSPIGLIYLQLSDFDGSPLTSDTLPTTPPILNDWEFSTLHISSESFAINAQLTSLTLVPEPATLLLLTLGGILLRKRRT